MFSNCYLLNILCPCFFIAIIAVSLAVNNRDKLQDITTNNLTEGDVKHINKTKRTKSQINEGIISDNEIDYIKKVDCFRTFYLKLYTDYVKFQVRKGVMILKILNIWSRNLILKFKYTI